MVVVSRFGAASAPWVAQYLNVVHEVLPFTVMGGLAVIAAIVMFKLKETNGAPTAETLGGNESDKNYFCITVNSWYHGNLRYIEFSNLTNLFPFVSTLTKAIYILNPST